LINSPFIVVCIAWRYLTYHALLCIAQAIFSQSINTSNACNGNDYEIDDKHVKLPPWTVRISSMKSLLKPVGLFRPTSLK